MTRAERMSTQMSVRTPRNVDAHVCVCDFGNRVQELDPAVHMSKRMAVRMQTSHAR